MLSYVLKRLLLFIPAILILGLFSFYLFQKSPGDTIDSLLRVDGYDYEINHEDYKKEYKKLAKELHRDLPVFYFSIIPSYYPDTLHKVVVKQERKVLVDLLKHHQDWNLISNFILSKDQLIKQIRELDNPTLKKNMLFRIDELVYRTLPNDMGEAIHSIISEFADNDVLDKTDYSTFMDSALSISKSNKSFLSIPKFAYYGSSNQFHYWMTNFFRGKLGRSIVDGRSVWSKLSKAFTWTFFLTIIGTFIAVALSVPIGIWSAYNPSSTIERILSNLLYFIYSFPIFWLATLMIVFFTTKQYAGWTDIFPNVGILPGIGEQGEWGRVFNNGKQLILPIFCMVIHSLAYLSRIVRISISTESNKSYVNTAYTKGLHKKAVYKNHLLPNSLIPLVTILTGAIPASMAGSLVIEVIFNIPGIGRLLLDSINGGDSYVIFSIVLFLGVITMIFYLLGDIIYSYLDPKIRFNSKSVL